jgi:hypothetical protein
MQNLVNPDVLCNKCDAMGCARYQIISFSSNHETVLLWNITSEIEDTLRVPAIPTLELMRCQGTGSLQYLTLNETMNNNNNKRQTHKNDSIQQFICRTQKVLNNEGNIDGLSLHILPDTKCVHRWR